MASLILDSDVMLNWLLQEVETQTGKELWVAPAALLELGERRQLEEYISLVSLLELRFVLRRKKKFPDEIIEQDLRQLQQIVRLSVPTPAELEQAERLQGEEMLDPFDSILLAQALTNRRHLVTRDRELLNVAKRYGSASTPEEYIESLL